MMPCPKCGSTVTQVLDSRLRTSAASKKQSLAYIWRRRICKYKPCGFRWTTIESQEGALRVEGSGSRFILDRMAYDYAAQILTKLAEDMRRVRSRRNIRARARAMKPQDPTHG